jgi:hypothetical protein
MEALLTGHSPTGTILHLYRYTSRRGPLGFVALCDQKIPVENLTTPFVADVNGCKRCLRRATKQGYIEFEDVYGFWFDIASDGTCTERAPRY